MSAMFPFNVWQQGTLQPSTPVNDAFLRVEILQRGAASILSAPPGSPADGQVHILGASPTGAWSTFAQNDVVLWRSGTWYRFAPFLGWLKQVGTEVRRFDGTSWVVVTAGGGGAVPIQEEGTTVVAAPTAINFVGAGVTVIDVDGVATVMIPGGDGSDPWTYVVLSSDFTNSSTTPTNITGFAVTPVANKTIVIEGNLLTRADATTTGPRVGITWPTTVADGIFLFQHCTSASGAISLRGGNIANNDFVQSTGIQSTGESWPLLLNITMVSGASPSGTLNLTLRSEVAGSTVTVRQGSWIRYRTIN